MPPHIAELFRLTPRDLNWAYEKLEGQLIHTINSKMGKFRTIRLTSEWEHRESPKKKVTAQPVCNADNTGEQLAIDKEEAQQTALQTHHTMDSGVEDTLRQLAAASRDPTTPQ